MIHHRGRKAEGDGFFRIARDLLLAEHYRRAAPGAGLRLIEVDKTRSAEEVAAAVGAHFGPAPAHAT